MHSTSASSSANRDLRRFLRDLAALTALPAVWKGAAPQHIAENLADVLVKLFYPDFVYVRLKGSRSHAPIEVVRTRQGMDVSEGDWSISRTLEPCLPGDTSNPTVLSLPHPFADGEVQAAVVPIGYGCEFGLLVVAGSQPGFPTDEDRLLLGVAANESAVVLQHGSADEVKALLAAIVESSEDAIVSKTLDGVITSWNRGAERLFEYTADEAVGRHITLIIPADRQDEEVMILSRLRRGEQIEHFETIRQAKSGRLIDISLAISPVRDSGGRIIGASKVARDITNRKKVEEALREADRRKDEFLAMLAHELRNPLAPIRNAVQVLYADTLAVADLHWARNVMDRQLYQLTRLVDDLLDVARITQGKIVLRKERLDLSAVVNVAVEGCRPLIEKKGHSLTATLPDKPVTLEADSTRLAQILMNLLNNAAKYTEEGGRITLTAELEDDKVRGWQGDKVKEADDKVRGWQGDKVKEEPAGHPVTLSPPHPVTLSPPHLVRIRVKDTGIGIPREMLPQVFEIFIQVEHALERTQGGLGLGLTLAKRLTEMHGGTLTAHSDGPGEGSEFVLTLPVAPRIEESGTPQPAGAAQTHSAPQPTRTRILVVDDNRDAAESLAVLLRMIGHEVHTAHDGVQAVEKAAALRPSVVLLDIGLPKLNGYEAARRIRQAHGAGVKLIALTGWGQEANRRQSREVGFDHHLTKPVEFDALQRLLAGGIGSQ
jgi:PAS domain S-box-containing protein